MEQAAGDGTIRLRTENQQATAAAETAATGTVATATEVGETVGAAAIASTSATGITAQAATPAAVPCTAAPPVACLTAPAAVCEAAPATASAAAAATTDLSRAALDWFRACISKGELPQGQERNTSCVPFAVPHTIPSTSSNLYLPSAAAAFAPTTAVVAPAAPTEEGALSQVFVEERNYLDAAAAAPSMTIPTTVAAPPPPLVAAAAPTADSPATGAALNFNELVFYLKFLPAKNKEKAKALLSGEINAYPPFGPLITSVWRVQLGESGRGDLKKEISEQLNMNPKLKNKTNSISKLKTATVEQLVVISEIVGVLKKTLQIAYQYEVERSCVPRFVCQKKVNKYRAASLSRFPSVSSLDQHNEGSKQKEHVVKIGQSTITETHTITQGTSCHKSVGTPSPFSPSRQRVAKRRNTAAVAAAAAATAGTVDITAAGTAAEVIYPGEATSERLISTTDVSHNLHSSLYLSPTATTTSSETGGAATAVAATMTPTPGVVAAAAAPPPITPAAAEVAATTAAAAPKSTAAVADSGDLCWMISDLTSSWTRPDCFTSCDSIFGREGETHMGTSSKSYYDCLESNGVAGSLHTGVLYTSRSDDSGNSGFSDDFYNFGSSSFGSRLTQGVGGEHTPKDKRSSSVWSSSEVANEENREEYKCTQQVLNNSRDRSQSILCCGLPTGPTTRKRKICDDKTSRASSSSRFGEKAPQGKADELSSCLIEVMQQNKRLRTEIKQCQQRAHAFATGLLAQFKKVMVELAAVLKASMEMNSSILSK